MPTDRELAHGLGNTVSSYTSWTNNFTPEPPRNTIDVTTGRYGAWCDGSHDDSDAWLRAQDDANRRGGTIVWRGISRIRRPLWFPALSTGYGEKAVHVQGAGRGSTQLHWDPINEHLGADCLKWGQKEQHCYFGGPHGFALRSRRSNATGALVRWIRPIELEMSDMTLVEQHSGVGFRQDSDGAGFNEPGQNLHLLNVNVGLCGVGIDLEQVAQSAMYNVKLNMNHAQGLHMRSGSLLWHGGLLQGGEGTEAALLGSGGTASIDACGLWVETACPVGFRLSPGCAHVKLQHIDWSIRPGQIFVHATNSRNIVISGTDCPGSSPPAKLVYSRGSRGSIRDASPDATKYDIDGSSNWVFYTDGNLGTPPVMAGVRWV